MPIVIGSTSAGTLGTITLADVKSLIQAHGYGTDTTAIQTTAVQSALRELYGQRRWKFLRQVSAAFSATVANDGIVDISTLGRGIMPDTVRTTFGTDYEDLTHASDVDVERARHLDRELGAPTHWTRRSDSLLFYPRPNATYTLEIIYQALTTIPTADGDTVQWPETHIMVVVWTAIMVLCFRQRDWNGRQTAKQELADAMIRLMRDEEMTNRQTGLQVGSWSGWARGGTPLP
jgi:hypothetical protein